MSTFNRFLFPIAIAFCILLIFYIFTKILGPIPFAVNSVATTKTNVFQVSGDGKVSAAPDTAELSFGVTKNATTVSEAQDQTNSTIQKILDALSQQGIQGKDIRTTDYSITPNYDYTSGRQRITGYTVSQTIDAKITPISKINSVLDIVTTQGANIVNQVSFTFSDDLQKQLEDKARKLAVEEAKTKAQSLAIASGIHLGQIINVEEQQDSQQPIPLAMPAVREAAGAGTPTEVTPGENSISLTVTLSYQTY